MNDFMLNHLVAAFEAITRYIINEGWKHTQFVQVNQKGTDVTVGFDLGAEQTFIRYCEDYQFPVKIIGEETGETNLASGQPEYVIILDPVDGSTNLKKGKEGSSTSIAVLGYSPSGLRVSDVQYALIGSLQTGSHVRTARGHGVVFHNGRYVGYEDHPVRTSPQTDLTKAMLEIDLDYGLNEAGAIDHEGAALVNRVLGLFAPERQFKHLRRSGSTPLSLMDVAKGSNDGHIDLRNISTPENWVAGYLLVREAGGVFTDRFGQPLDAINDFRAPFSYVASGNETLHQKVLDALDRRVDICYTPK